MYRAYNIELAEKKFTSGDELTKKRDYLNANIAYIEGLKKDNKSKKVPAILYIMASNYIALTSYEQAIIEYDKLLKSFPDSERAEDALFMIGMVYKNCIGDKGKAINNFNEYLQKYPFGKMANEVKMYLKEYKNK